MVFLLKVIWHKCLTSTISNTQVRMAPRKATVISLLVLLTAPNNAEGLGSYCMSTDCTTAHQHKGLSLYLSVCCAISNLGHTVSIRDNGISKYILCPKVRPKSCPGKLNISSYMQQRYT